MYHYTLEWCRFNCCADLRCAGLGARHRRRRGRRGVQRHGREPLREVRVGPEALQQRRQARRPDRPIHGWRCLCQASRLPVARSGKNKHTGTFSSGWKHSLVAHISHNLSIHWYHAHTLNYNIKVDPPGAPALSSRTRRPLRCPRASARAGPGAAAPRPASGRSRNRSGSPSRAR